MQKSMNSYFIALKNLLHSKIYCTQKFIARKNLLHAKFFCSQKFF